MRDIKQEFIFQRLIVEMASTSADNKKNNKAMKMLQKIHADFEKDIQTADSILSELLKHENACVRSGAATHCVALGIRLEEAENVLLDVAKTSENRVISFNAWATLKVWKEQGFLSMYPEKGKSSKRIT